MTVKRGTYSSEPAILDLAYYALIVFMPLLAIAFSPILIEARVHEVDEALMQYDRAHNFIERYQRVCDKDERYKCLPTVFISKVNQLDKLVSDWDKLSVAKASKSICTKDKENKAWVTYTALKNDFTAGGFKTSVYPEEVNKFPQEFGQHGLLALSLKYHQLCN